MSSLCLWLPSIAVCPAPSYGRLSSRVRHRQDGRRRGNPPPYVTLAPRWKAGPHSSRRSARRLIERALVPSPMTTTGFDGQDRMPATKQLRSLAHVGHEPARAIAHSASGTSSPLGSPRTATPRYRRAGARTILTLEPGLAPPQPFCSLVEASVPVDQPDKPAKDDERARTLRLLLLSKGAVSAVSFGTLIATELDETEQPVRGVLKTASCVP